MKFPFAFVSAVHASIFVVTARFVPATNANHRHEPHHRTHPHQLQIALTSNNSGSKLPDDSYNHFDNTIADRLSSGKVYQQEGEQHIDSIHQYVDGIALINDIGDVEKQSDHYQQRQQQQRIVGGEQSDIGEFPYFGKYYSSTTFLHLHLHYISLYHTQ